MNTLYKFVVYCQWYNRRGKFVGRNYRTKVYASSYNEGASKACEEVERKYNGNCNVIYGY